MPSLCGHVCVCMYRAFDGCHIKRALITYSWWMHADESVLFHLLSPRGVPNIRQSAAATATEAAAAAET